MASTQCAVTIFAARTVATGNLFQVGWYIKITKNLNDPMRKGCSLFMKLFLFLHNTVEIKRLSGKITPKANQTLSPEYDVHAQELHGNNASWLVIKPMLC